MLKISEAPIDDSIITYVLNTNHFAFTRGEFGILVINNRNLRICSRHVIDCIYKEEKEKNSFIWQTVKYSNWLMKFV